MGGLATYGRGFTLASPDSTNVGAPQTGRSKKLFYTGEAGVVSYYETCQFYVPTEWDDTSKTPYKEVGDQWYGYDNKKSLKIKVQWLKKSGFGGAMVWAMDLDDFSGAFCNEGKYPLLNVIKNTLYGSDDDITPEPTTLTPPITQVTTLDPSGSTENPHIDPASYKMVCYFTNWAQYRKDAGSFKPNNIDPTLCTHLNYAFAVLSEDGTRIVTFEWNDETLYKQVMNLRRQNPKLKIMISVGGWNEVVLKLSAMLQSKGKRQMFAQNAIQFVRRYGFDGLDLDFEYPGLRG